MFLLSPWPARPVRVYDSRRGRAGAGDAAGAGAVVVAGELDQLAGGVAVEVGGFADDPRLGGDSAAAGLQPSRVVGFGACAAAMPARIAAAAAVAPSRSTSSRAPFLAQRLSRMKTKCHGPKPAAARPLISSIGQFRDGHLPHRRIRLGRLLLESERALVVKRPSSTDGIPAKRPTHSGRRNEGGHLPAGCYSEGGRVCTQSVRNSCQSAFSERSGLPAIRR